MTNQDYTALLFVIDRSGSVHSIRNDLEGGLTTLLGEQDALDGKATVDIAYFDDKFDYNTEFAVLASASVNIVPRGMTALHDAIVRAVTKFGASLSELPEDERPGKVVVVVATDGLENASRESTADDVKRVIQHQTDTYGWQFVFLGANQDAVTTGTRLGFAPGASLSYSATSKGVHATTSALNTYVSTYRSAGSASFSDDDRKSALEES